ncbi:hypothetical protein JFU47_04030 [Pseudomonas sp. TH39(2020)]|uniref:hypothetical protein n=1 Tax=Pseudomonas sp. TH39(2020) TaxID=2796349 RepID=UPI0019143743|nr:hypothetical protein [Pseudomonas sp. TH39(2020)]
MSIFIPELFYFSTWVTADNGVSDDLIEKDSSQINLFTQALAYAIFGMVKRFTRRKHRPKAVTWRFDDLTSSTPNRRRLVPINGRGAKAEVVFMSLALTIFGMIAAWMAIAISMLWGVLRIARRRHYMLRREPSPLSLHRCDQCLEHWRLADRQTDTP